MRKSQGSKYTIGTVLPHVGHSVTRVVGHRNFSGAFQSFRRANTRPLSGWSEASIGAVPIIIGPGSPKRPAPNTTKDTGKGRPVKIFTIFRAETS